MAVDKEPDAEAFRRTMSHYPTGVAVITAEAAEGAWAITVNSLVSVSADEHLVMWALDDEAYRYALFAGAPSWGVSILHAGQADIANRFAVHGPTVAENHEVEFISSAQWKAPVLKDALARLDCRTMARHHVADHMLIVGKVNAFDWREGDALTYFRSRYGKAESGGEGQ
jgi:flavin reductase (DIM6/NTAB) family NADH-FMN oxidoreductase RutF